MDVSVTGRHCQISDEFRSHVQERITKLEKISDKVIRVDVQVSAYGNKRQPDESSRVEITLRGKGPVVRAEAQASQKEIAFDKAVEKLRTQLRKAADRRKVHHGARGTQTLRDARPAAEAAPAQAMDSEAGAETRTVAGMQVTGDGPLVVREKTHAATPLSLDQALEQMELVGHDFFLFVDVDLGVPSVVYRRRAYDYGVIRLQVSESSEVASHQAQSA